MGSGLSRAGRGVNLSRSLNAAHGGARSSFTDFKEEGETENFEPKWTKNIPNWAMCNWFYAFFLANLIVATLIIFSLAYVLVAKSALKHVTPFTVFLAILHLFVAGTNALFYYLICDRSLQPEK